MTEFQDQTVLSGEGRVGDCFRACLASVLGRKSEAVPHFALLGDVHAMQTAIAWLQYKGYGLSREKDDYDWPILQLCIGRGYSSRGIAHAVVCDTATGKMLHDPHPSREGVKTITGYYYIFQKPEEKA